jgi:hypothetical protein
MHRWAGPLVVIAIAASLAVLFVLGRRMNPAAV